MTNSSFNPRLLRCQHIPPQPVAMVVMVAEPSIINCRATLQMLSIVPLHLTFPNLLLSLPLLITHSRGRSYRRSTNLKRLAQLKGFREGCKMRRNPMILHLHRKIRLSRGKICHLSHLKDKELLHQIPLSISTLHRLS